MEAAQVLRVVAVAKGVVVPQMEAVRAHLALAVKAVAKAVIVVADAMVLSAKTWTLAGPMEVARQEAVVEDHWFKSSSTVGIQ